MNDETLISFKEAAIYQKDHLVLSNVAFDISKGEFVYLIGRVGSGKSSLIKTINVEIPLKYGFATVAGYQLSRIKNKHIPYLRRKLGIVFQDFQLLIDRTVYNNLLFVLKATGWKNKLEIKNRIIEVLDLVGLEYKGYKMPHELSEGEKQRVVIARALLNSPDIILADEPTGNLDPETSEDILKLLLRISEDKKAVLIATHNYQLLNKFPSRTLKCEKGKLIEVEKTSEIDFQELLSG